MFEFGNEYGAKVECKSIAKILRNIIFYRCSATIYRWSTGYLRSKSTVNATKCFHCDINTSLNFFCSNGIFIGSTNESVSGHIWLDDVECCGDENKLEHCTHAEWGVENCFHGENVKVECNNAIEGTNAVMRKNYVHVLIVEMSQPLCKNAVVLQSSQCLANVLALR